MFYEEHETQTIPHKKKQKDRFWLSDKLILYGHVNIHQFFLWCSLLAGLNFIFPLAYFFSVNTILCKCKKKKKNTV